jgi:5-methylcytosine-specific restriction protein A
VVAEQAVARVGLDGAVLPAHLAATARSFAAGGCSLRSVEVIARVLASPAARRLPPEMWAAAEERLAAVADEYSPADLQAWGGALVEALDQDGPEPDDRPPAQVNELYVTRHAAGSGGRIRGRFDDPAMFAAATSSTTPRSPPGAANART